jgi:arylsulfatase A-like enzyme
VASFIHSPLLPKTRAGTVYMGLVHATDWRPTFAFLAGVQPDESGPYPLDGHSIWDAVASGGPSPRNEVVMNIIKPSSNYNKTCTSPMAIYCNHSGHSASGAAIRQGQYKLVVGYAGWPDLRFQLPAATQPYGNTQQAMVDPADQTLRCADKCLFDVVADPGESEDLQAKLPEVVAKLEARLAELAKEGMPRLYTQDCAPHCGDDCAQVQKTGYYLPYQDHEVL